MARPIVTFDAWPLLPRPRDRAGERPADEPAQAAFAAAAGLAALFLLLRWTLPGSGLPHEVAKLVTLWGCLGGLGLVSVLMGLLVGAASVAPMMPSDPAAMWSAMRWERCATRAAVWRTCSASAALSDLSARKSLSLALASRRRRASSCFNRSASMRSSFSFCARIA